MQLFGKKVSEQDLRIERAKPHTATELNAINNYIEIQKEMEAKERMEREKDPKRKEEMKRLINRKVYNFDYLFGKEK